MRAVYAVYYALAGLFIISGGTAHAARNSNYPPAPARQQSPYRGYADYMAQRNHYYPPAAAYSNRPAYPAAAYRPAPQSVYRPAPRAYPAAPQPVYRAAPAASYPASSAYRPAAQPVSRAAPRAYRAAPRSYSGRRSYPAAPRAYSAPRSYAPQNTAPAPHSVYRYHGTAKRPAYSVPSQPAPRTYSAPPPLRGVYLTPQRRIARAAPRRPRIYSTPYNGGGYHCRYFPYPNAGGTYSTAANNVYNSSWSQNHARAARPNATLNPICGGFSSNIVNKTPYAAAAAPLAPQPARRRSGKAPAYAAPRQAPLNQHLYP